MILFSNVTKNFGQDLRPALDSITLQVEPGEFVFLTGPSGSGKSTLLKLLTKEYTPTSGEIVFQGKPLDQIRRNQLHAHRRKIGVVFQDYRLLPELNVWENIALSLHITNKSLKEIEERVTDLLDLVQLTDKAYSFPAQLSGGEAQRVGIARALATAPNVILADEPTGNLDPQTTMMIAKLFDKIHELGTTILFATHDVSILSTFKHRRIHLEKGRLVSDSGSQAMPQRPQAKTENLDADTSAPQTVNEKQSKPGFSFHLPKLSLPFKKKKKDEVDIPEEPEVTITVESLDTEKE